MSKNSSQGKAPKATTLHSKEQQERIRRMQEFVEQDQKEQAEIIAAYRRGDTATAQAMAVARYGRTKIKLAAQDAALRGRTE